MEQSEKKEKSRVWYQATVTSVKQYLQAQEDDYKDYMKWKKV